MGSIMPAPNFANATKHKNPPWIAGHPVVVVDVVVHHDELSVRHNNEPSLLRHGLNILHQLNTQSDNAEMAARKTTCHCQVSRKKRSEEGNLWVSDGGLLNGQGPVKQHTHLLILIINEKLS